MDRHPDDYDRHWADYEPPLRDGGYRPSEADYYAPSYHRPSPHHRGATYGPPRTHETPSHRESRYEPYHDMRSPATYHRDTHGTHSPHYSTQRTPGMRGARPDVSRMRGDFYQTEYPPHAYEYSPRAQAPTVHSMQSRSHHPHHCTCGSCLGIDSRPPRANPSPDHYAPRPPPHMPMTHSHHSDLGVKRRPSESTFIDQKPVIVRTQPPPKSSPRSVVGYEQDGLGQHERQSDEQAARSFSSAQSREEEAPPLAATGNGNKRAFRLIAPQPKEEKAGGKVARGRNGKVKGKQGIAPTPSSVSLEASPPDPESEPEETPQPETKRRRGRRLDPAASVAMFNYRKGIDKVFFRMVDALGLEVLNEIEELIREALGAQFVARMHLDFKDLCYLEDTYRRQTVFLSEFLCTVGLPGVITRRTGEILYLNDPCCEMLKVDRTNVIDVNFLMFVHASKLKEFFSLSVVKLLNPDYADQIIVDTTLQRPCEGALLPVRITLKVIRDIYFFPSLVVIMFHPFLGPDTTSTPTIKIFPSTSLLIGVLEDEDADVRPKDPTSVQSTEAKSVPPGSTTEATSP